MQITWKGAHANNYQKSRNGSLISKVVIHWIVGTLESADATFQSPTRIASAHYGIGDGDVHQYVKEEDTAYHAGSLSVNRQSIGIEHEGGPTIPVTDATYQTSGQLIREICARYNIPLDRQHIIKHSEVPRATSCPGTIDVDRLISIAKQGGSMAETDQQKIARLEAELRESNTHKTNLQNQVNGFVDDLKNGKIVKKEDADKLVSDSYTKGFEDGKNSVPVAGPTPPTSPNESEWIANGKTESYKEGDKQITINYAKK